LSKPPTALKNPWKHDIPTARKRAKVELKAIEAYAMRILTGCGS
jgi:hypothetical protein